MKRTPLARKTPIARGTSQLKRSRMARGRPGKQPPERRDDAFLAHVRRQRCCMCMKPGPSHAHHPRTGAGTGIKASDSTAISLCLVCHYDLHALSGAFKSFQRAALRAWEEAKNSELREAFRE